MLFSLQLTDYPRDIPLEEYHAVINKLVLFLQKLPGILSIYQIGSVSNPGISDVDLLVVFDEYVKCSLDPREILSQRERYLVVHGLFGSSVSRFMRSHRYSFFHNYQLLWGERLDIPEPNLTDEDMRILKRQIAIEYLVKMYADTVIELTYKIIRVRGLLLHVKGLGYDLEFLNITDGRFHELVSRMIQWRDDWFRQTPSRKDLVDWIKELHRELSCLLEKKLALEPLYMPVWANMRIAMNTLLVESSTLGYKHGGVVLPPHLAWLGRKYFNIQHRFNQFEFRIPYSTDTGHRLLVDRFEFLREMKRYNSEHVPHFVPSISSLNVF